MKNPLPKIAAFALLWSYTAPVSAQPPSAAPGAPVLEIQISSSQKEGKELLTFGSWDRPALSLVIRNVSAKPVQLFDEWNRLGYKNIHLEITAVNGEKLPQVLVVEKEASWPINTPTIETLAPNRVMVRDIRLHWPAEIRHPQIPTSREESRKDDADRTDMAANEYCSFPFAVREITKTVTMKAVYEVPDADNHSNVWTGRVESPLLTYEIGAHGF